VLLDPIVFLFHLDDLDHPRDRLPAAVTGLQHRLRLLEGAQDRVELVPLLPHHRLLLGQHLRQALRLRPEERLDLLQREAQELEGQDLLQAEHVRLRIQPVAGLADLRGRQQPHAVIEAQRAPRDRGLVRELAGAVECLIQG
jgi:hypothetical protein